MSNLLYYFTDAISFFYLSSLSPSQASTCLRRHIRLPQEIVTAVGLQHTWQYNPLSGCLSSSLFPLVFSNFPWGDPVFVYHLLWKCAKGHFAHAVVFSVLLVSLCLLFAAQLFVDGRVWPKYSSPLPDSCSGRSQTYVLSGHQLFSISTALMSRWTSA